jgi:hypothetical protein
MTTHAAPAGPAGAVLLQGVRCVMEHRQAEQGLVRKALPLEDIYQRAAGLQIEFFGTVALKAFRDGVSRAWSGFDIAEKSLLSTDERALIKNTIGLLSPEPGQCTINNAITLFILFYSAIADEPLSDDRDDDLQSRLDLSPFVGVISESQVGAACVVSAVIVTAYARETGANVNLWELANINVSNAFKLVSRRIEESNIAMVRYHAQRAANASHDAHRSNKQKVRDWYSAHRTMTKDAAAEKMAKDGIVHASFRTIRGYLIGQ